MTSVNGIYVVIFVICAFLSPSYGYNKNPKVAEISCEDPGVIGFCSDCLTQTVCEVTPNIRVNSEFPCQSGFVCQQIDNFAACVEASQVPQCQCPVDVSFTQIPDFYDNQKYIVCVSGNPNLVSCNEEFYDPNKKECVPNAITEFPPVQCASVSAVEIFPVACNAYQVCIPNVQTPTPITYCKPGEIATNDINEPCKFYAPFSCSDYLGTGYFADTTNCQVAHLCSNGQQIGQDIVCGDGMNFNNITKQCGPEESTPCAATVDCGICTDDQERITIDCTRYYQCSVNKNENGNENMFEPILKTCPPDLFYDPVQELCASEVDGCP